MGYGPVAAPSYAGHDRIRAATRGETDLQPGRGGGWSLVGGARTDLTGLTQSEAKARFLLAGPAAALDSTTRSALRKLVQALPEVFRADGSRTSAACGGPITADVLCVVGLCGMAAIESTVTTWLGVAALAEVIDRHRAWVEEYEPAHPEAFDTYYRGWGSRTRRDRSAEDATEHLNTPDSSPEVRVMFSIDPQHHLPDRFGYWVGAELVTALRDDGAALTQLAALTYPQVKEAARRWITQDLRNDQ